MELAPFDRATLDHFIYLERPEGVELPDGEGFQHASYRREMPDAFLMPSAQDYLTVGHLYRGIEEALQGLAARLGEAALFIGNPALQVGPELAALKGLVTVQDLASARLALGTIVEQGEGSGTGHEESHYNRFLAVRDAYAAREAAQAGFVPSRPVVRNPLMRKPVDSTGRTYIDHPGTAPVMDLANAIYTAMLRCLAQGFGEADPDRKRRSIGAAIDSMFALVPVAEHLTRLPACQAEDGRTAGISFAMLRDVAPLPAGDPAMALLAERFAEMGTRAGAILPEALAGTVAGALQGLSDKLAGRAVPAPAAEIEVAEGRDIIIRFEAKRCIHARFCVLQQPGVFKANVKGEWIVPDDATTTEGLVATSQACPSGAIQYSRRDGGPEEAPPPVNLLQLREDGPLAIRAAIELAGADIGTRATLCRCGASRNKPFCDGSHKDAAFQASGEPATGDTTALASRDGTLAIHPQKNGPLAMTGNIEVLSGTGRTIGKTTNALFCRCGQSRNKPYCDGSHQAAGFVAP